MSLDLDQCKAAVITQMTIIGVILFHNSAVFMYHLYTILHGRTSTLLRIEWVSALSLFMVFLYSLNNFLWKYPFYITNCKFFKVSSLTVFCLSKSFLYYYFLERLYLVLMNELVDIVLMVHSWMLC